ncbi:unnamed protein product [Ranitomeya imitator]|uniref:Clarin 2 n=1 Tax=Ranitomeya imitator TaxID=111125 RepID=A0ABN9KX93_9NEOB|nr:unnamed protein product [Ranitomeya imitator]
MHSPAHPLPHCEVRGGGGGVPAAHARSEKAVRLEQKTLHLTFFAPGGAPQHGATVARRLQRVSIRRNASNAGLLQENYIFLGFRIKFCVILADRCCHGDSEMDDWEDTMSDWSRFGQCFRSGAGEVYWGYLLRTFSGGKVRQCGLGKRSFTFKIQNGLIIAPMVRPFLRRFLKAVFQHDNARSYDAGSSVSILRGLNVLPWPAASPDLSPIEHITSQTLFVGNYKRSCQQQLLMISVTSTTELFPDMVKTLNTTLHVIIILFLLAAISFALISAGFCVYNALKVPYCSIKGPAGICLWNFIAGLFIVFAVTSFIAAVQLHQLTERIANFRENVFRIVILEEHYEDSFWLCVASGATHAFNILLMAASTIRLPKFKTKTEEANVTAEDIMY